MLGFIRKHSSSIFVKVFLGLIAFTFLFFFGMSDVIRKYTGKDYVIKIGSVKIGPNLLKFECSKRSQRLKDIGINDENAILGVVVNQLIDEHLVDEISKFSGISVSEKLIKTYIRSVPEFVNTKTGQFNKAAVRNFMAAMHLPEDAFIEFIKRNIQQSLLVAPLSQVSSVAVLPTYISANLEKRNIKYAVISPDSVSLDDSIKDSELESFFDQNKDKFMEPETRDFTVLILNENKIAESIDVLEEDIKREYTESGETEEYDIAHDRIRNNLKNAELEAKLEGLKRSIEDDLTAGVSCKDLAEKYKLEISLFKKIKADYVTPAGYKNAELPFMKDVVSVAYQTDLNQDSSFVESLDKNNKKVYWILHNDNIVPEHVADYGNVKTKVVAEYKKSVVDSKMAGLAQSYVEKINEGNVIDFVVKGYKISSVDSISRNDTPSSEKIKNTKFNEAILEKIFNVSTLRAGYEKIGDTYVVFQITSVVDEKEIKKEDIEKYAPKLSQEMTADLMRQLKMHFTNKFGVKINKEMLKQDSTQPQEIDF